MEEESTTDVLDTSPTGHESHRHARSRSLVALAAIAFVLIAGVVWSRWGEQIKEVCTGKSGACTVPLPDESAPPSSAN